MISKEDIEFYKVEVEKKVVEAPFGEAISMYDGGFRRALEAAEEAHELADLVLEWWMSASWTLISEQPTPTFIKKARQMKGE